MKLFHMNTESDGKEGGHPLPVVVISSAKSIPIFPWVSDEENLLLPFVAVSFERMSIRTFHVPAAKAIRKLADCQTGFA